MSNRGSEYSRMKKGETKKLLAIVQSRRDTNGRSGAKLAAKAAAAAKASR